MGFIPDVGRTEAPRGTRAHTVVMVWSAALAGLAAVACFVPLLDVLGFEFSLVIGLAGFWAAAHLGYRTGSWTRGFRLSLITLLPPLVLSTLNALRVRNCDLLEGLELYLLIPVAGAAVASGWGAAARVSARVLGRWGASLLVAGVVWSLVRPLLRFVVDPQISFFGAAFGWWPGAIYDEALGVPSALAWSRISDLALAAALVSSARVLLARARPRSLALVPLVVWIAWGGVTWNREALGYYRDRSSVLGALPGELDRGGVTMHYDPQAYDPGDAGRLMDAVLHRLEAIEGLFGIPGAPRGYNVYIYASRRQRARLMGADRVSIAKPWLGEVHLAGVEPGDSVITHELAHVVAARLGPWPSGMPSDWWIIPHMGLVEGAAVAAQWDGGMLTPHRWAAALRRLSKREAGVGRACPSPMGCRGPRVRAPDIRSVMGRGFYLAAGARAYTLAGSFVRFLIERHGPRPFQRAYLTGDLHAAYQVPEEELFEAWERYVDSLPVTQEELELARERYARPAIFHRVCAREVATAARRASRAEAAGQYLDAARIRLSVVTDDPGDPSHLLALARTCRKAGWFQSARWFAAKTLEHPKTSSVLAGKALELLGDVAWLRHDESAAARRYREAWELRGPLHARRARSIKLLAATRGDREVMDYLLEPESRWPAGISMALSVGDDPVRGYLVGRILTRGSAPAPYLAKGIELLETSLGRGWPEPAVRWEIMRLAGWASFRMGRYQDAARWFQMLEHDCPLSGVEASAKAARLLMLSL